MMYFKNKREHSGDSDAGLATDLLFAFFLVNLRGLCRVHVFKHTTTTS